MSILESLLITKILTSRILTMTDLINKIFSDHENAEDTQKIGELFDDFEPIKEDDIEFAINKKLNPDFIGFNKESSFKCEFLNDQQNNVEIKSIQIEALLASNKSLLEKCDEIIGIYKSAFQNHIENLHTKPDVCIIIIPSGVFKKLSSIRFEKGKLNFRRKLKAEILLCQSEIPVQLVLEDTILGKKKRQDDSMIAWNFVVAQY